MLRFHAFGRWSRSQVFLNRQDTTRQIIPEVEAGIDRAWTGAIARPGIHLFDGPMCRIEKFHVGLSRFEIFWSETSYRIFLGTNLCNPGVADLFGSNVMANPIGISTVLQTADGYLALGRRNAAVAYHPNRIHPFAGALEPRDAASNVFDAVHRELAEELAFTKRDVVQVTCLGMVEDLEIRQPELVFSVRSPRTSTEIQQRLDLSEHDSVCLIFSSPGDIAQSLSNPDEMTPVAIASLLLHGRDSIGENWFAIHSHPFRG